MNPVRGLIAWGGRLGQSLLNRGGPEFISTHARPKFADQVSTWSDRLTRALGVGIVVQGPIVRENEFTVESVRLYRKLFPDATVVVSTWEGESRSIIDSIEALGAVVRLNRKPPNPGPLNVNFQLASTRGGVETVAELGLPFVLKTRSDQRIYLPNALEFLVNLLKAFPVVSGFRQSGRVVSCGRSGWKYGLYQISDQILFGTTPDLLRYFEAPYRADELPEFPDEIGPVCRHKAPEAYLASTFLAGLGRSLDWTVADSRRAVRDHFCIVDWSSLDGYWPKYGPHLEHDRQYRWTESTEQWSFRDWLIVYASLSGAETEDIERALSLSLRVPLRAGLSC